MLTRLLQRMPKILIKSKCGPIFDPSCHRTQSIKTWLGPMGVKNVLTSDSDENSQAS